MIVNECSLTTNSQGRELTEHGTALFPVACYHDDLTQQAVPWHWHDELEAVVVETGTAIFSAGGQNYTVPEGNGFFINAGILHGVWPAAQGDCRLQSVVFHPRLVGGSMDSIFWQNYLQPLLSDGAFPYLCLDRQISWHQEALQAIQSAWLACLSERPGYEFEIREALSKLIFRLCSSRPAPPNSPSEKSQRNAARIKTMLQYIQAHYSEELSTAKIAQSAAISQSECLRCFQSMIGTAPIQYVNQLRIQKAAGLLTSTEQKISDIAALCGFQEMSYFAKTFRKTKGLTPSAYRKRSNQQQKG